MGAIILAPGKPVCKEFEGLRLAESAKYRHIDGRARPTSRRVLQVSILRVEMSRERSRTPGAHVSLLSPGECRNAGPPENTMAPLAPKAVLQLI